jgi:hypothetical protein
MTVESREREPESAQESGPKVWTKKLCFHYLTLNLTTHNQKLFEWIGRFYESHDQSELFPDRRVQFDFSIEEMDERQLAIPETASSAPYAGVNLTHVPCYYDNGRFQSSCTGPDARTIEVDLNSRVIRIALSGRYLVSEEAFVYEILRNIFKVLLFPLNFLLTVHAAVVTDGASTIVIAGENGSGKSTLALKLTQLGFRILSDDSPLFTFHSGTCFALSSLDELSVTEGAFSIFPWLGRCTTRLRDTTGKYLIPRAELGNKLLAYGPSPVTAYIELDRDQRHTSAKLVELNKHEMAREFTKTSSMFFHRLGKDQHSTHFRKVAENIFDVYSGMCGQSRMLKLEYSDAHLDQLPLLITAATANGGNGR